LLLGVVIARKNLSEYNILQENDHAPLQTAGAGQLLIVHKITNMPRNSIFLFPKNYHGMKNCAYLINAQCTRMRPEIDKWVTDNAPECALT
jgi:hypothetical protein